MNYHDVGLDFAAQISAVIDALHELSVAADGHLTTFDMAEDGGPDADLYSAIATFSTSSSGGEAVHAVEEAVDELVKVRHEVLKAI